MTTTDPSPQPTVETAADEHAVSALAGYLDTVSTELTRRAIPVLDRHVQAQPLLSGRIRLAHFRHRRDIGRCRVILTWAENHGWGVMLHPPGQFVDDPLWPWAFLHRGLVVEPTAVASFATALLHDDELGMPYPAQFRYPGHDLPEVITSLIAHTPPDPG